MLLAEQVRSAASPEGMIVLAVIYFIFWVLSKVGKKAKQADAQPVDAMNTGQDPTQQEGFSLERVLRQIEEVKRQAEERERQATLPRPRPQPAASRQRPSRIEQGGPLGRHSRSQLPGAEEVEERDTLEGGSLEVEEQIENLDSRVRTRVDQDDQVEAIIQRRKAQAEARNRAHRNADHKAFDQRIREPAPAEKVERRYTAAAMRDAFVWREILGPPKALE
jgi:hypothetical protein